MSPRRAARRLGALAALLALGAMLGARGASAQPGRPRRPPRPLSPAPEARPAAVREAGDIRGHFGVAVAERLLASPDAEARLRAVRRLASIGTAQGVDLLVRSQEPGAPASRDLRARLEAVRGLSPFLAQDGPRQVVLRALVEGASLAGSSEENELAPLLRDTAALVLAEGGGPKGFEALWGLLRQGGSAGAAAGRALLAYPPEHIEALLSERSAVALAPVELLEAMGDLRALPYLRRAVRQGDPETRAAALAAMASLGDPEAGLIGRSWAGLSDPAARLAAAGALVRAAPAEGRALVAALLGDPASREAALALALRSPGPELVGALLPLLAEPALRARVTVALGRSGGEAACAALGARLSDPAIAHEAGLALALAPGAEARRAIEAALADPARRTAAIRAGAVRTLGLRDPPAGLEKAAVEALGGAAGAGRQAAAFALVALGARRPGDPSLLADAELAPALGRGALALGPEASAPLLEALGEASDPGRRAALGAALLARPDAGPLPTSALIAWLEEGGALAPLAARALGARDDAAVRSRVGALLASGDPALRAHVALGLGHSPEPDAAGRLAGAYLFEPSPGVRRALLKALASRPEARRRASLELAARLDPDPAARSIARSALRGRRLPDLSSGDLVAWASVRSSSPESFPPSSPFRWERPDGLVVPVVPDADGSLLVPGLPAGLSHVTLAAPPADAKTAPAAPLSASALPASPPPSSAPAAPPGPP